MHSRVFKFCAFLEFKIINEKERNTGLSESWIKGIDLMPMGFSHGFNFLF